MSTNAPKQVPVQRPTIIAPNQNIRGGVQPPNQGTIKPPPPPPPPPKK